MTCLTENQEPVLHAILVSSTKSFKISNG